jgi:hypothetical protein
LSVAVVVPGITATLVVAVLVQLSLPLTFP